MKKTYIKPSIETINIGTQQVIAVSSVWDDISFDDDSSGWGDLNNKYAGEDAHSRNFDLWED